MNSSCSERVKHIFIHVQKFDHNEVYSKHRKAGEDVIYDTTINKLDQDDRKEMHAAIEASLANNSFLLVAKYSKRKVVAIYELNRKVTIDDAYVYFGRKISTDGWSQTLDQFLSDNRVCIPESRSSRTSIGAGFMVKSSMVELYDSEEKPNSIKPKYWWVNHKQTYKQEVGGGYIWSPKENKDSSRNHSYDNMPKTNVGNIIFSYADGYVKAIGRIATPCLVKPKPEEFGDTGKNWNEEGWFVGVDWTFLNEPFKPKLHIDSIRPHLADKYAPVQPNGNGNQGCYLAEISSDLAHILFGLSDFEATHPLIDQEEVKKITAADDLDDVTKLSLVEARTGQGRYKKNLIRIEPLCRFTGISNPSFLIASHIKPWAKSDRREKLDGFNGLLLSPHVDKLFDGGWISISESGNILCVSSEVEDVLESWEIDKDMHLGEFTYEQQEYLKYHRDVIFEQRKMKFI